LIKGKQQDPDLIFCITNKRIQIREKIIDLEHHVVPEYHTYILVLT